MNSRDPPCNKELQTGVIPSFLERCYEFDPRTLYVTQQELLPTEPSPWLWEVNLNPKLNQGESLALTNQEETSINILKYLALDKHLVR